MASVRVKINEIEFEYQYHGNNPGSFYEHISFKVIPKLMEELKTKVKAVSCQTMRARESMVTASVQTDVVKKQTASSAVQTAEFSEKGVQSEKIPAKNREVQTNIRNNASVQTDCQGDKPGVDAGTSISKKDQKLLKKILVEQASQTQNLSVESVVQTDKPVLVDRGTTIPFMTRNVETGILKYSKFQQTNFVEIVEKKKHRTIGSNTEDVLDVRGFYINPSTGDMLRELFHIINTSCPEKLPLPPRLRFFTTDKLGYVGVNGFWHRP